MQLRDPLTGRLRSVRAHPFGFLAMTATIALIPWTLIYISQLPDHHACRFGKWYDGEGKHVCGAVPSFTAIDTPHARIHAMAKDAVAASNSNDKHRADRIYKEMEDVSGNIASLLDRIKIECRI